EEGFVPGGALVGGVVGGFGADRVGGVVVTVDFPAGADRGGLGLPLVPRGGVVGDGPEGLECPDGGVLGGVLAEALFAVVHHLGNLGQVGLPVWVGQVRYSVGPGSLRLGEQRVDALADAVVENGGDIAGSD